MTFMTQSGLIAASTGLFYDNTVGAITPSGFRQMHENIADSMVPYDASGVFQVNTTPTGSVPIPTATGSIVFDTSTSTLHVFNGTWLTFSTGGE